MKTDEQLWEICMDIYRQAFKESDPPGDFDKMIESGEVTKREFFMNYFLPDNRLEEIIASHTKKNKLKKIESRTVYQNIMFGCAPRCFR